MTNWNKKYEEDFNKKGTERFFSNLKSYNSGGSVSKGYQSQIRDFNRAAPKILGGSSYGKYLDDPGNKSNALALATSLKQNGLEDKSILDSMNSVLDEAEKRRKKQDEKAQKAKESKSYLGDIKKVWNNPFVRQVLPLEGAEKGAHIAKEAAKGLGHGIDTLGDVTIDRWTGKDDLSETIGKEVGKATGHSLLYAFDKLSRFDYASQAGRLAQAKQEFERKGRTSSPVLPMSKSGGGRQTKHTMRNGLPQLEGGLGTGGFDPSADYEDKIHAINEGFHGRDKVTGIDVWRYRADHDKSKNWMDNRWAAAVGGTAADVALDPLSYLGLGLAKRAITGGAKVSKLFGLSKKAAAAASKARAKDTAHFQEAAKLASRLAKKNIPKNAFKGTPMHEALKRAGADSGGNHVSASTWERVISSEGSSAPVARNATFNANIQHQTESMTALADYLDNMQLKQAGSNFSSKLIADEIKTAKSVLPDFDNIRKVTQQRYDKVTADAGDSSFIEGAAKATGKKEAEIVDQLDFDHVKGALRSHKDRVARDTEGSTRTYGGNSYSKYLEDVRKENKVLKHKGEPEIEPLSLSDWTSQPKYFDEAMGSTFRESGLSASERVGIPRMVRDSLYGKGGFVRHQEFVDTNKAAKTARESARKHQKDADKLHAEIKDSKTSGLPYDVEAAQAKIDILEGKAKDLWSSRKTLQEKADNIEANATIQHTKELLASKKGRGVTSKNQPRTNQLAKLKKLAEDTIAGRAKNAPKEGSLSKGIVHEIAQEQKSRKGAINKAKDEAEARGGPENKKSPKKDSTKDASKEDPRYTREEAMSDKPELASEKKQAEKESSDSTRVDSEKDYDPNIRVNEDAVLSNPEVALEKINKELKELESPVGSFVSNAGPVPKFFQDSKGNIDINRIMANENNPDNLLAWEPEKHKLYIQTTKFAKKYGHELTDEEKTWATALRDQGNAAVAKKVDKSLVDASYRKEVIENLAPKKGDGAFNAQQRMERLNEQPYPKEPSDANNGLWTPEEVSIRNADVIKGHYLPVPGSDEGMSFAIGVKGGIKNRVYYSEQSFGDDMRRLNLVDKADNTSSVTHNQTLDEIVNIELKGKGSVPNEAVTRPVGKEKPLTTRNEIIDYYEKQSRAAKTKEDLHAAQIGRAKGLEDHANGKPHDIGHETVQDRNIRRFKMEQEELNKVLHTYTVNNRTQILEILKTARDGGMAAPTDIKYGAAWLYRNHKAVRKIVHPEHVAFNRHIAKESGVSFAALRDARNRALAYNDRGLIAQTKGKNISLFNRRFDEGLTRNEFMKKFFQGKGSLYEMFHTGPFSLKFTTGGKKFASHKDVINKEIGPFPIDEGKDAIRIWKAERVKIVEQYTKALDEAIKADPLNAIKLSEEAWSSVPKASRMAGAVAEDAAKASRRSEIDALKTQAVKDKQAADRATPVGAYEEGLKWTAEHEVLDVVNGVNKLNNAPTAETISIPRASEPIKAQATKIKESSRKEFSREAGKLRRELKEREETIRANERIGEPRNAAEKKKFKNDQSALITTQTKYRELRNKFEDVKQALDDAAVGAEQAQKEFRKQLITEGIVRVMERGKDPERVGIALRVLGRDAFVIPGTEQLLASAKFASSMPVLNQVTKAYNKLLRPMSSSLSLEGRNLRAEGMSITSNHVTIITNDLRRQFKDMSGKERKSSFTNYLNKNRSEWGDAEKAIDTQFDRLVKFFDRDYHGSKLTLDDFTYMLGKEFGVTGKARKEFFKNIKKYPEESGKELAKMIGTGDKSIAKFTTDPFHTLWAANVAMEQAEGLLSLKQGIGAGFGIRKHSKLKKGEDVHGDEAVKALEKQGWKEIPELSDRYLFSPEVMPEVKKLLSLFDKRNVGKVMSGFDGITRIWKQAVTIYNPGYYVRNFIGEVITGMMGGVWNPKFYAKSVRGLKYMEKELDNLPELLARDPFKHLVDMGEDGSKTILKMNNGENLSMRESTALYYGSGVKSTLINTEFKAPEGGGIANHGINQARKNAHHKVQNFGEWNEDLPRFAHFLHAMQNAPKSMDKAARAAYARDEVMHYHFDYSDITNFEKTYMMRVVPFYKWTRKAMPLLAEMYFKKPGIVNSYAKVMNGLASGMDEDYARNKTSGLLPEYDKGTPDYLKQMMAYPLGKRDKNGQHTYFNIQTPQTDAIQALMDPFGNVALNMMNPLFKMPYEQFTGKRLGGFDFGQMHGGKDRISALMAATPATKLGHKIATRKDSALLEDAPKGGWGVKGKRLDETSLNFITGLGFREEPPSFDKKNAKMQKEIKRNRLESALDTIMYNDDNGDFDFDKFARANPNDSQWTKDLVKYNNPDGTFNLRQKLKDQGNPKWPFVPEVVPQTDPTPEMKRKTEVRRTVKNASRLKSELKYDYDDPKNDTPERRKREARLKKQYDDFIKKNYSTPIV